MLKDPDDRRPYRVNWGPWLADQGADTIATSQWIVPAGLEVLSDTHDATTATVWLAGGVLNSRYILTNRITTAAGRQKDTDIPLDVRNH